MNLAELAGALGYTVHVSNVLPFETTAEDGTRKRTDYIVSETERKIWMSQAAFDSLKRQTQK